MSQNPRRMTPTRALLTLVVLLAAAAWQAFSGDSGGNENAFTLGTSPGTDARSNPADSFLPPPPTADARDSRRPARRVDSTIEAAFRARLSNQIVQATGRVKATLRDDNEGSRHQRLIVELPSGRTVLIAHNIDLAPRVPVERGDSLEFRGEYEWNDKGGVVHWTHRDPQNRHDHGWIEHRDRRYE